jgi:hypothetical protein
VTSGFELRPDELTLLEMAARLSDEITVLQTVLAEAQPLVTGSKGQTRTHPAYSELRGHRLALSRMLGQLGFGDADADAGLKRSSAGRRLAGLRWHGGNHG